jgi:hypothetical protein
LGRGENDLIGRLNTHWLGSKGIVKNTNESDKEGKEVKIAVDNFWIKVLLLPLLLIIPVVWFAAPLIPYGTDNIRLIRHLDLDEAGLIEFAAKIYSQGLVPMDGAHFAYPQLFYYVAGFILFPFTLIKGIDYTTITVVLRLLSSLSIILTIILLYFFSLRFFKSIYAAVLSSALLATMPEYLWWSVNSRPHPLEILFILVTFYFCFRLVEKYDLKHFAGAVIFAALAASVKYGGVFLIPIIWLACLFDIFKMKTTDLINHAKARSRVIYGAAVMLVLFIVSLDIFFGAVITRIWPFLQKLGIKNIAQLVRMKDFQLLIIGSVVLIIFGCVWFYINKLISDKLSKGDVSSAEINRYLLVINKSILIFVAISSAVILLFAILNPTYWVFPFETFKNFFWQFVAVTIPRSGSTWDPGINRQTLDLSGFGIFLSRLFDGRIFSIPFGVIFIFYVLYEVIYFRNNWRSEKVLTFQRMLLLAYVSFLFMVLSLTLVHRPHHYVLPIGVVLTFLIPIGMIKIMEQAKVKWIKTLLIIFFCLLLTYGFYSRLGKINEMRELRLNKINEHDPGIIISKYLELKYKTNIKICTDHVLVYVPPKYPNVYILEDDDEIRIRKIKALDPDVLVLMSSTLEKLVMDLAKRGRLPHYKIVKQVEDLLRPEGLQKISVLERVN